MADRVTLEPINERNYETVFALEVTDEQRNFVASNMRSIAQAFVYKGAEPYAIRSGEEIVGFAMLYPLAVEGEPSVVNLVRIMIDRRHQRRGLGRQAIETIVKNARRRPGVEVIQLSVIPENRAAIRLYEAAGFRDTGQFVDGEKVYRLRLYAGRHDRTRGSTTRPDGVYNWDERRANVKEQVLCQQTSIENRSSTWRETR